MSETTTRPDLKPGDVIRPTTGHYAGQLRFFRQWYQGAGGAGAHHSPADAMAEYSTAGSALGEFEVVPAPPVRSGYDLVHHMLPRVIGWKRWEVIEEMDGAHVANMLPGGGWMSGFLSGSWFGADGRRDTWAKFALVSGQGVPFTGEAYVLVYGRDHYVPAPMGRALADAVRAHIAGDDAEAPGDLAAALAAYDAGKRYGYPRGFRVAVCAHEKIVGAGANPTRGWHPGHCGKCGLNMTVDSGD